jgi:hypothetical protein
MIMRKTMDVKGAVIGMIMGDANLNMNGTAARIRLHHSHIQRDYLLLKKEVLDQVCSTKTFETKTTIKGVEYSGVGLYSVNDNFYTKLYRRFYYLRRKTFDLFLLDRMSVYGLLFWFLDDGTKKRGTNNITLCTDWFNRIEHLSLQKWFHDKWGLTTKIHKNGSKLRLYFGKTEYAKLAEKFAPYISSVPECVVHKFS